MFEWLKKLFRRQRAKVELKKGLYPVSALPPHHFGKLEPTPLPQTKIRQSPTPFIDFEKSLRQEQIRLRNQEKQRNTLGYGLKSRNFRPRPAWEKKNFDLSKKPQDEDD